MPVGMKRKKKTQQQIRLIAAQAFQLERKIGTSARRVEPSKGLVCPEPANLYAVQGKVEQRTELYM
jgi:hypothetical protein